MRDDRDRAVVLLGRHLDRHRAEIEGQPFDDREVRGPGLFVAAHHPGPADEQVGTGRDRSPAFTTGEGVRADVAGEVDAALAQFVQRRELHACDIRHDRVGIARQLGRDDVRDDVRGHGDDHEPRLVVGAAQSPGAVIHGQSYLCARGVIERDIDPERHQGVPDARAEQPGTDHADGAAGARGNAGRGRVGH